MRTAGLAFVAALSLDGAAPARAREGYDLCAFLPSGAERAIRRPSNRTGKFDNCQATFAELKPLKTSVMLYDHGSVQAASIATNNSVPRVNNPYAESQFYPETLGDEGWLVVKKGQGGYVDLHYRWGRLTVSLNASADYRDDASAPTTITVLRRMAVEVSRLLQAAGVPRDDKFPQPASAPTPANTGPPPVIPRAEVDRDAGIAKAISGARAAEIWKQASPEEHARVQAMTQPLRDTLAQRIARLRGGQPASDSYAIATLVAAIAAFADLRGPDNRLLAPSLRPMMPVAVKLAEKAATDPDARIALQRMTDFLLSLDARK